MIQTITAPPTAIHPLNASEIRQSITEGRHLITSGQLQAAAVLLWSAFESAVRLSLTDLGQRTEDPISISDTAPGLSAQAVAYGVIDPEDRAVVLRFLSMHGGGEAIDVSLLQEVGRFTERTLDEMNSNDEASEVASSGPTMPVTINDVIAFINAHPGRTFYTTGQQSPFTVSASDREFVYTLSSDKTYRQPRGDMEQLLQRFTETHSLTPSDYHHPQRQGSRFSSYFVGLMSALGSGRSAEDN